MFFVKGHADLVTIATECIILSVPPEPRVPGAVI